MANKIVVTYNNNTIYTGTAQSGTTILHTAGKICTDNIVVQYSSLANVENAILARTITGYYFNDRVSMAQSYVLRECTKLTSLSLPKCEIVYHAAFLSCTSLATVFLPKCSTIYSNAFPGCVRLTKLYLTNSSVAKLSNSSAFNSTPIGGYSATAGKFGSIYVPSSLLASYKAATNWTYFSSRFVAV